MSEPIRNHAGYIVKHFDKDKLLDNFRMPIKQTFLQTLESILGKPTGNGKELWREPGNGKELWRELRFSSDELLSDREFMQEALEINEQSSEAEVPELFYEMVHPSLLYNVDFIVSTMSSSRISSRIGIYSYFDLEKQLETDLFIATAKTLWGLAENVRDDYLEILSTFFYEISHAVQDEHLEEYHEKYAVLVEEAFDKLAYIICQMGHTHFNRHLSDPELFLKFSTAAATDGEKHVGEFLTYLDPELLADFDYTLKLVDTNAGNFAYVDPSLKTDKEFVMEVVKMSFTCFEHAAYRLRDDFDVVAVAYDSFVNDNVYDEQSLEAATFRRSVGKHCREMLGVDELPAQDVVKNIERIAYARKLEQELSEKPKSRAAQLLDDVQGDKPKQTNSPRPMRHKL